MKAVQKQCAMLALAMVAFSQVQAGPIYTTAVFTPADHVVSFDEVPLPAGASVTNQYQAQGVRFSTVGGGAWKEGGFERNIAHFNGRYLDNFSGSYAGYGSAYRVLFTKDVDAAGAYFEFNTGSPAATFSAWYKGVMLESFSYSNANCCSTAEFLGFSGRVFDELRISNITQSAFIMDSLQFSDANAVPEPSSLALAGLVLGGVAYSRRRKQQ